jgi:transposase-like protein
MPRGQRKYSEEFKNTIVELKLGIIEKDYIAV